MPVKSHLWFLAFALALAASYGGFKAVQAVIKGKPDVHAVYFYDKYEQKITLKDFKGKAVVLNLWATWCPPCLAEMPSLNRLQAKLGAADFRVVAVALDRGSLRGVEKFMRDNRLDHLEIYWDRDRQVPLKLKYDGLPTSFILDRTGAVIAQYDGVHEWDREPMLGRVREALGE